MEDITLYYKNDIDNLIINGFETESKKNKIFVWKQHILFQIKFEDIGNYTMKVIKYHNLTYEHIKNGDRDDQVYNCSANGVMLFKARECDRLCDFVYYVDRYLHCSILE